MEFLEIIVLAYLMECIFQNLMIVCIDHTIKDGGDGEDLNIRINLNEHPPFNRTGSVLVVNHIINLALPSRIFPKQQNMVSFEYQLITLNIKNQQVVRRDSVILVRFWETAPTLDAGETPAKDASETPAKDAGETQTIDDPLPEKGGSSDSGSGSGSDSGNNSLSLPSQSLCDAEHADRDG